MPNRARTTSRLHYRGSLFLIRLEDDVIKRFHRSNTLKRLYRARKPRTYMISEDTLAVLNYVSIPFRILEQFNPKEQGCPHIVQYPTAMLYDAPAENVRGEILAQACARKSYGKPYFPVYYGRTHEPIPNTFQYDIPGGTRSYVWKWERRPARKREQKLQDYFPKFRRFMKRKNTRIVLALSSGGIRFFAHAAFMRLLEALEVNQHIDEIWGCSGGAIAGAALSLGLSAEEFEREGYKLYSKKTADKVEFIFPGMINNLISNSFMRNFVSRLRGYVNIQHELEKTILKVTKLQAPKKPLFTIAFNLDEQRMEVLTPESKNISPHHTQIRRQSILDCLMASASIPVLFEPHIIRRGGVPYTYLDGAIGEEVPCFSVHQKWLQDRKHKLTSKKRLIILLVNIFPFYSLETVLDNNLIRKLPFFEFASTLTKLSDISNKYHTRTYIQSIRAHKDVEVFEFHLTGASKVGFLDPKHIPLIIDKSRHSFFKQLLALERSL